MTENTKEVTKDDFKKLKEDIKKDKGTTTKDLIMQVATRDKLERDYKEDLLQVEFYSSPETKRMVKAKRPTQEEMMLIMKLSAEAAIYEGKMDANSLKRMVDIYDRLPDLAAKLSVDKSLDDKFWKTKVSFSTLQNFITELIRVTQQGPITESELKSFRGE